MPSPAALLSAKTSLSAIPGGSAGTGNGSITPATGATQGIDFSSLLPSTPELVPARAVKLTLPVSAPATADTPVASDNAAASGSDQAPASSGKSLPLAALTSAVLPVPITLSALTGPSHRPSDTTDDSDEAPTPGIDTGTIDGDALALMAMAQTSRPIQNPQTVQPAPSGMTPCAGLTTTQASTGPSFPVLAMAQGSPVSATDGNTAPTERSLPNPGFTLFSPEANADTATLAATSLDATVPGNGTSGTPTPGMVTLAAASTDAQPSITLTAATAIAMAQAAQPPSGTTLSTAQPGFTLLADNASVAAAPSSIAPSIASPMPQLALTDPVDRAEPDAATLRATADAASGATAAHARLASPGLAALDDSQPLGSGSTTTTSPNTLRVAQAQPAALPSHAVTAIAPDPAPTVQLASARTGISATQGRIASPAARNAIARPDTGARPAIDLDVGDPQPGFSSHSPTSPSADGVSVLDNAPSLSQPSASAGTAAVAQTLAATGGAAISLPTQQTGTDMAALVDRLVEARAAARSGLSSQVVQASLNHSDFGRVSLRFNTDKDGLNVSMTSNDPGFAPAAQAALAQTPAISAKAQSQGPGQQDSGQQGSGQPGLHWTQSSSQPGLQANTGGQNGMGGSSGQGGQGWAQGGQNNTPASQNTAAAKARAATTAATSTRNRGGILA